MMRLGFVGLGNLGGHLAASLLRAGFPLTVHDRRREAADPLLAAGAAWADSPRAVAEASESVLTCLPTPAAVAEVVGEGSSRVSRPAARGSTRARTTRASCDASRLSPAGAASTASRRRSPAASTSPRQARSR